MNRAYRIGIAVPENRGQEAWFTPLPDITVLELAEIMTLFMRVVKGYPMPCALDDLPENIRRHFVVMEEKAT